MKRKSARPLCMSRRDRPIPPENRMEASRWLGIAEEGLDVVTITARFCGLRASGYHIPQAAEQLINAMRMLAGGLFRCTQALDDLVSRLPLVFLQFDHPVEPVHRAAEAHSMTP